MTKPRKPKKKRPPPRQLPPKEGRERLKPISLHGMSLDDVLKRLVQHPGVSKPRPSKKRGL